jgi:hypothetical protein
MIVVFFVFSMSAPDWSAAFDLQVALENVVHLRTWQTLEPLAWRWSHFSLGTRHTLNEDATSQQRTKVNGQKSTAFKCQERSVQD